MDEIGGNKWTTWLFLINQSFLESMYQVSCARLVYDEWVLHPVERRAHGWRSGCVIVKDSLQLCEQDIHDNQGHIHLSSDAHANNIWLTFVGKNSCFQMCVLESVKRLSCITDCIKWLLGRSVLCLWYLLAQYWPKKQYVAFLVKFSVITSI